MSEYIPKYPSEEGDDSNKTSSELLAETLKPIYVPQDLMLAWETHLASYSRDTHVLLDQVKESEDALNAQYQALLTRVQKYEQMLQDITMDSNEFTMDSDVENFTGWNILAQASYWDYLLRKEITKLRDQIKSAEFKGELVTDVSNSVLESLATGNQHISTIIRALTDSSLIRDLDAALSGTSTGLSQLRIEHEALKAKQYADAIALADQNGQTFDQLTLTFNNLISEQIDRLADEAATRTRVLQELEDGITAEAQLRYEGQEALASQVLAIKTSTETAVAGILQDYSTIAGTNEAITTALNTYSAQVDGTIATILTDYVSYANLDYALTSKTDTLMSIINNNVAQLTATNEISASLDKVRAVNTLSVDINGVVSGYGLISSLEDGVVTSAFGVNADTFYIGKPTDAVKPFVVTTVPTNIDGIDFPAGTWINSAIIADATIGTAHIKDASITNAKIKELDASKITTGTLDAQRIRVGSSTQFDSGYAPSDVYNSAKSYVDRNTGNLVNNPSVSENTVRWSNGTVTDQAFLDTTIPALTLTTSGDLMTISDKIDVDPAKAYEVSVWVKKSAAVGSTYLGLMLGNALGETIQVNAVNQSGGSSLTNNFYHWNVSGAATPTDWTKLVAYVMPAGTNPSDLKSVGTVTSNAIMLTNSRKLQMRLLNYYNGGTTTTAWFANPKIVEVDPNAVIAAAKAQILADSKTQTFTAQPAPPYTAGDLWKDGSTIRVCTVTRASGSYVAADWILVGDVTSANTAANSNQLGGQPASTIINNINAATDQLTLWKFPNTTEIDGGKIRTNTITANQIQVDSLSAISANLGTIKVDTANIDDLAVTTGKIRDLAVDTLKIAHGSVTSGTLITGKWANTSTFYVESADNKRVMCWVHMFGYVKDPAGYFNGAYCELYLKRGSVTIAYRKFPATPITDADGSNYYGLELRIQDHFMYLDIPEEIGTVGYHIEMTTHSDYQYGHNLIRNAINCEWMLLEVKR